MPQCKNCQKEFVVTPVEESYLAKFEVPHSGLCLDCRRQRLLAFWPFGNFYQRKCDLTGELIISTFSPNAPFPVYKRDNWLTDRWQPPKAEVDLNKSFFEQLRTLQSQTPHYHMLTDGTITNCDYCDDIYNSKNCYLTRSGTEMEDLYFCYRVFFSKDSFDCVYCYKIEKCYSCTRLWSCYNVKYSLESRDCLDSYWLYDCRGCKNCFMCWNLRNAEYCINNKKYSPAEYEKKIVEFNLGSWDEVNKFKNDFKRVLQNKAVHRLNFNNKNINSVDNYLTECKNCQDCFFLEKSEDCHNLLRGLGDKDVYDSVGAYRLELSYLTGQSVDLYNTKFANYAVRCRDSEYLDQCEDCNNCFGCVGLRKKNFCVLNKQYTEKDYQQLVAQIKEKMKADFEYGQFFPLSMMYNGYNDTLAHYYFPETKKSIVAKGGAWQEEVVQGAKPDLAVEDLPDNINDCEEKGIVGKTIKCLKTDKVFRYISQEFKFYKDNNIPLARLYYNYRLTENFRQMTPLQGREAVCANCQKKIVTYYPVGWGFEKIYCQKCYEEKIY